MESKKSRKEGSSSKYKGVRKRKWGKWVSEIRLPNSRERIWLGSYDTPEKAARAFDAAALCLRGRKSGAFNFPRDLPDIPLQNLPPSEVQAVASRFANESPPPDSPSDSPSDAFPTAEDALDWSFIDSAGSDDPTVEIGGPAWPSFYDAMDDLPCEFSWPNQELVEEQSFGFFHAQDLWDF